MTDRLVHLVRHGEVENPLNVVYADLSGFVLSGRGRSQARAAALHLAAHEIGRLITSPLDRAVETARALAGRPDRVELEARLTEWRLSDRWAGTPWPAIESTFPGEMTGYLEHPEHLEFAAESIEQVGTRVMAVLEEATLESPPGDLVLVSHQDPIQACRLRATGRSLTQLHRSKPGHGSVVTLQQRKSSGWREVDYWEPDQGELWPPVDRRDASS